MRTFTLTAVLREEDGVYVSKCPELSVASCGDTPHEALTNVKEAVELYLENAKEPGIDDDEINAALKAPHTFTLTFEVSA